MHSRTMIAPFFNTKRMETVKKNEVVLEKAFQIIPLIITTANEVVKKTTETKIYHDKIVGLYGSATSDFGIINSTIELSIDEKEVFPELFEASLINRQVGVNINELPYKIERKAKNSKVKITYTDGGNVNAIYPYTYNLYLVAETATSK